MKFLKGSGPRTEGKISAVIAGLQVAGLTVDKTGNVAHKGFVCGSLTPTVDFVYHVRYKHTAAVKTARRVMRGMRRSSRSSKDWKPNS